MSVPGGWMIPAAVGLAAATAVGVYAVTQEDSPASPTARTGDAGQYPQAQFALVQDQGSGLVQAYCTACHSLAPILRHSGFTAETWASEVQKMRETYGAPIDDPTAAEITAYLQKHYTVPPQEAAGTSRQVWSEPTSGRAAGE